MIVKPKRARRHLKKIDLLISWKAIADKMETRSVDDIRNFWALKVLPLFDTTSLVEATWTEQEDIALLKQIAGLDVFDSEEPLDFDEVANVRTPEQNRARWTLLLKGLGSVSPGMRFNPTKMALKLVQDIETKDERYVAHNATKKTQRTGMQSYIDIVDFYKKHFT